MYTAFLQTSSVICAKSVCVYFKNALVNDESKALEKVMTKSQNKEESIVMSDFNDIINFDKAVALSQSYDCFIDQQKFERFANACLKLNSPVHAVFRFYKDPQGLRSIAGFVECEKAVLRCERCGGEFETSIKAEFCSSCDAKKAESLKLSDKYDLVECEPSGDFRILDYLEDCLLLELPYAPKHAEGDPACKAGNNWTYGDPIPERPNPFAALGELKGQLK